MCEIVYLCKVFYKLDENLITIEYYIDCIFEVTIISMLSIFLLPMLLYPNVDWMIRFIYEHAFCRL